MEQRIDIEYIVLGAGPAGLQIGYYLDRGGRDYLILEAGDAPGGFFRTFPRHRKLISSNKVETGYTDPEVNLRWDWNSLLSEEADGPQLLFKEYSREYFPPADTMVRYLRDWAERFRLRVRYGVRATRITREAGLFRVDDGQGAVYTCRRLIVATGVSKPYLPPIPGIELAEHYVDVSVDPEDFVGQKVLVIGKGNSGFETADNLIPTTALIHIASPNPLQLAWKTHFVGHLRAVNNNLLDTYQLKSQNAILDCSIERIELRGGRYAVQVRYTHAGEEAEELIYDRVIACTGFRFDASIFDPSCRPELAIHDRFPAQTCEWESTNVEGLYFVGTLTQVRDFKKSTSGFIHGFRYNARALWRVLARKHHGEPWPSRPVEATPEEVTHAFVARMNRSSGLWQQFGFLCDVLVLDGDAATYYEEMPLAYVHESDLGRSRDYFTLTLEFGKIETDPFHIVREPVPEKAAKSTFLHPVVRRFSQGRLLSEHHILENLFGEWRDPQHHVEPLLDHLRTEMLGGPGPMSGLLGEASSADLAAAE